MGHSRRPHRDGKSCMLSVGEEAGPGSAAYSPILGMSILTTASIQAISDGAGAGGSWRSRSCSSFLRLVKISLGRECQSRPALTKDIHLDEVLSFAKTLPSPRPLWLAPSPFEKALADIGHRLAAAHAPVYTLRGGSRES